MNTVEKREFRMEDFVNGLCNYYGVDYGVELPDFIIFVRKGVNTGLHEKVGDFIRREFRRLGILEYNGKDCMRGYSIIFVDEHSLSRPVSLFFREFGYWVFDYWPGKIQEVQSVIKQASSMWEWDLKT